MDSPSSSRPQLFGLVAGLFLATALVLAAIIFTRAWMAIAESQSISVTGSAHRTIRSDLIIWRGTFSAEAEKLLPAQQSLKADQAKVEQFLRAKGVTNFLMSPIGISELHDRKPADDQHTQRTVGYRLSHTVEIRSAEVDRITQLTGETAELVEQNVVFVAGTPEYVYTKASEAKVEMLAEATKDARARAEQIARMGGRQIKQLRSAKMGVFQITPPYSTETSWGGVNDVTSLEKAITAIVSAQFSFQ